MERITIWLVWGNEKKLETSSLTFQGREAWSNLMETFGDEPCLILLLEDVAVLHEQKLDW